MSLDAFDDDDEFVTETEVRKDDSFTDLERTINTMENSHICLHPKHCHSFQQVNFMVSLSKCAGCQQRIQTVVFGIGSNESNQVVRCVACGAVAHRSCALSRHVQWTKVCPVNAAQLSSNSSPVTIVSNPEDRMDKDDKDEEDFFDLEADSSSSNENSTYEEPISDSMVWTQEGPPEHWANSKSMEAMIPTIAVPAIDEQGEADEDDENQVNVTPLHHANHPFASVSRALQENILAHFRRSEERDIQQDSNQDVSPVNESTNVAEVLESKSEARAAPAERENSFAKFASGTYDAVRTSVNMPRKVGAAVVAGSIAGGVAGLAIAGPAGAFAGYKLGQTAGALGVILEGSVSIGVFVASVATGSFTGKQIQDQIEERRILTMGEDGTSRKVLLVRPNIQIDPVWDQICADARRNSPKDTSGFTLLPNTTDAASRDRYRRDSDIVKTAEEELPTKEKVFLLVSRILNDRTSLPGHIYRSLIQTFKDRLEERKVLLEKKASVTAVSPRARRDDAHAVIKHVTATLLEVRPGFGSTPALTESTAAAVESLVFGQLYELVFEEIVAETSERDAALMNKIGSFEEERKEDDDNLISTLAIDALGMLPEAHSAVDKLHYCVRFLELVSEHFSDGTICADSLLKLVCQHIVKARLAHMNAEVAFLEEFARDEQLLRGREGYALVTLQASLHFLNMSSDFEKDIFDQDDDEENVPVGSDMNSSTES